MPDCNPDGVKVISLYPAANKKHWSCIIELSPEVRKALENVSRLYIKWLSCRFADHASVLQPFKCLKFGHKAVDCKGDFICSYCAGTHDTKSCKKRKDGVARCFNCTSAGFQSVSHSACDKSKCPLLKIRIERKISKIDYGK